MKLHDSRSSELKKKIYSCYPYISQCKQAAQVHMYHHTMVIGSRWTNSLKVRQSKSNNSCINNFSDQFKKIIKRIQHGYHATVCMPGYKPKHGL